MRYARKTKLLLPSQGRISEDKTYLFLFFLQQRFTNRFKVLSSETVRTVTTELIQWSAFIFSRAPVNQ